MIVRMAVLIAVVAFSLPPETAFADAFVPATNLGNLSLDLNSAEGRFSHWRTTDLSATNGLRATLKVVRLGRDPRWAPTYFVKIASGDEAVILKMFQKRGQLPLEIHLMRYIGQTATLDWTLDTRLDIASTLSIAIDWTLSGVMSVKLGTGEIRSIDLAHCPTAIEVGSSTGEGLFDPLMLGRTEAPVCSTPSS